MLEFSSNDFRVLGKDRMKRWRGGIKDHPVTANGVAGTQKTTEAKCSGPVFIKLLKVPF